MRVEMVAAKTSAMTTASNMAASGHNSCKRRLAGTGISRQKVIQSEAITSTTATDDALDSIAAPSATKVADACSGESPCSRLAPRANHSASKEKKPDNTSLRPLI